MDLKKKQQNIANTEFSFDFLNPPNNDNLKRDGDGEFDLNIEKILENWEIFHAIREIIANAIDEQLITQTKDISIYKARNNCWHIIDYGRGLNYHHLTQNENEEKLKDDRLIGKFGVGLKDALATLYRNGVNVKISSRYGIITLKQASKVGFEDIITLHAEIIEPDNRNMIGTDFCLEGCKDSDIEKAKSLFIRFSNHKVLESTIYGDVIEKQNNNASIYINGVKVAEEPNFLFSYNITSLTKKLKMALNRERSNVGRTSYTDRVKAILLECKRKQVIEKLIEDIQKFDKGTSHDELSWQDVQLYTSQQLKALQVNTTFVTIKDLERTPYLIDEMKRGRHNLVVIPSNLVDKMEDYNKGAKDGETFTTARQFVMDSKSKFKPEIISVENLTDAERDVYNKTEKILEMIGGKPRQIKKIQIVEKIYEFEIGFETLGLWREEEGKILIKRKTLHSISNYAGTLLHECAHAISGANDVNRDFELELTDIIGLLASKLL